MSTETKQTQARYLCQFCRMAEASMVLEAHPTGHPELKTEWHVCEDCAIAALKRVTGVKAES